MKKLFIAFLIIFVVSTSGLIKIIKSNPEKYNAIFNTETGFLQMSKIYRIEIKDGIDLDIDLPSGEIKFVDIKGKVLEISTLRKVDLIPKKDRLIISAPDDSGNELITIGVPESIKNIKVLYRRDRGIKYIN